MYRHLYYLFITPFYNLISALDRDGSTTLMNYGYGCPVLRRIPVPNDERRSRLALYAAVIGSERIRNAAVLEVGCGRGGGADFVARSYKPKSYDALDLSARAVAFARDAFGTRVLKFHTGNAERLPFPRDSFDAVLSVESSHGYRSVPAFLSESYRVLSPGGRFLFADFMEPYALPRFLDTVSRTGFKNVRHTDITDCVLKAMDTDDAWKRNIIRRYAPKPLRRIFEQFAGMRGTHMYSQFAAGKLVYVRLRGEK